MTMRQQLINPRIGRGTPASSDQRRCIASRLNLSLAVCFAALSLGFNSPQTPGGALNGITSDFANIHAPKTPKTPKTPKGVAVPSRDSNFTEIGFPNWVSIFDGLLRKIVDEQHYGNAAGLDGAAAAVASVASHAGMNGHGAALTSEIEKASNAALLTALSVQELLQSTVGAHLSAFKSFLNATLRATPSQLPASPNPASISGPIPPLSQQMLLGALSSFLSQSLLPHQLQQVCRQLTGQNHFVLGQILRGAGFPVDTHVLGASSGGSCGIRLMSSQFHARIFLFKSFMHAAAARYIAQQRQAFGAAASPHAPSPIFYLSPSFAHSIGFPDSLPRLCWELGVQPSAFKVMPLTPTMDETILRALAERSGGKMLDPATENGPTSPSTSASAQQPSQPANPFLTYQLDTLSLESEVLADLSALQSQATHAAPCAVFTTQGNVAGLDLPYEFDNLAEVARIAARFQLLVHAEGTNLFPAGSEDRSAGANGNGGSASSSSSYPTTSVLFECVDSVLLSPGAWLGLSSSPTLLAFRNPKFLQPRVAAPEPGSGFFRSLEQSGAMIAQEGCSATSIEEFAQTFALWFNLIQINSVSFSSLLQRLAAKQADKLLTIKRMILSQNFPVFLAPCGEGDEERVSYVAQMDAATEAAGGLALPSWLPPTPSHPHLFFYVSLPSPWSPRAFHMDVSALNSWISNRLSARLSQKSGDYVSHAKVFGLHLLPVQHFDRIGFMYVPAPVSIWTSDQSIADDHASFAKLLVEVLAEEVSVIETNGRLRQEFEEMISAEAPEFVYVPAEEIEIATDSAKGGGFVGLGGVRFTPAQISDHHLDEVGTLLNEALSRVQSSMHIVASPTTRASQQHASDHSSSSSSSSSSSLHNSSLVSMYRAGRTRAKLSSDPNDPASAPQFSAVCTVLDLSELVLRKGLREILSELKSTAARLVYPSHITDDLNETLRQGIKAAEEKITTKNQDAYRPTNVLRWIPVVGSVMNYLAPVERDPGHSFDMKKKELSTIKYSYSNAGASGAGGAGVSAPGSRKQSVSGVSINPGSTPVGGSGPSPLTTPSPLSSINAQGVSAVQTPSGGASNLLLTPKSAIQTAVSPPKQQVVAPAPAHPAHPPQPQQQQQPQQTVAAAPSTLGRPPLPPTAIMHHSPPFQQVPVHVTQSPFQQPQQPSQQATQQVQQQQQTQMMQQQQMQPHSTSPPQHAQQPHHAPAASSTAPIPAPVSTSAPRTLPPVKVTLDEADSAFVDYLNQAPRSLQPDQLALLTRGENFLAYFPNDPEEGALAASSVPPPTSVTKLFLFYEPSYMPTAEESAELGVAPGVAVPLLCWCEPNVPRYIKADQCVAIEQVGALHLGVSSSSAGSGATVEVFPRQAVRGSCFSLVTAHVALHLEADSSAVRRNWFIALYTLVAQAPAIATPAYDPSRPQQQHLQLPYNAATGSSVSPSSGGSGSSGAGHSAPPVLSEAEEDRQLQAALALLQGGSNFTVFVLDKNDSEVTSAHEVVLWYKPAVPGSGVPHSLCWCRRGATLDFSPSRSLPLNKTVQICMGRQTKAFKNASAAGSDPAATFSVLVEKMILNLEASSPDERANWLSAFHTVMSASGKKRVFDAETEQQQQQQAQANQQQH